MNVKMQFSSRLMQLEQQIEQVIAPQVHEMEQIIAHNQWKIIQSFQRYRVSEVHFADSTGYGYHDRGRERLDEVYAAVFGAEAALVRPHFVSGTHTISTALFGVLRPGDELLYITGAPYETLHKVIGKENDGTGSLCDWGIRYSEVKLTPTGELDWDTVRKRITNDTKVIAIQRSCGYDWRAAFTVKQIKDMVQQVKAIKPDVVIFVDNCYGEFTERLEPTEIEVDLMAGSLIKNPGGGIVATGGYIVGKRQYVDAAAARLTAPGIGSGVGAMLGMTRAIYQGLFLAPSIVGQALRGSIFAAALFAELDFETQPHWSAVRSDLIQAIRFQSEAQLLAFIQGIQQASAVDAHVVPEACNMPGYEHPIIMAAGTFIQGGSLELSADAPICKPFTVYMQGGLTYAHVKFGVMMALQTMIERGLLIV